MSLGQIIAENLPRSVRIEWFVSVKLSPFESGGYTLGHERHEQAQYGCPLRTLQQIVETPPLCESRGKAFGVFGEANAHVRGRP